MSCKFFLTLTLLFASTLATAQNATDTNPGRWEYTIETRMPGAPMAVPPQTFQRCLTAQDVAQNRHLTSNSGDKNPCAISGLKNSGGKISFDFICKSPQGSMKGHTSGSGNATSLEMQTRIQMVPPVPGMGEMQQKMKARRIGNC